MTEAFCVVFQSDVFLAYHFTALSLTTLTYLRIERLVYRLELALALLTAGHHKKSRCYCYPAVGIPNGDELHCMVCSRSFFRFCFAVGNGSVWLYSGHLLQLHEHLENRTTTSEADTKRPVSGATTQFPGHVKIQWNPVNTDTKGTRQSVRINRCPY